MDAVIVGTGGAQGWPEDGCRCASCMRARSAGLHRAPGRVLIADYIEVIPGKPVRPGTMPNCPTPVHIEQLAGGLDITGPDEIGRAHV